MNRRYQVFVSSTFLDLREERTAIVSALLEMEAFPAGMELFPAADDDAWTLIERVIGESDFYLLVIGGKYGSIDHDTQISYTEKEYDLAVSLKRPVMAFLHADPNAIPFGKSEQDAARRTHLTRFRARVEAQKHVKYWTSPEDLSAKVTRSLASARNTYSAIGWIRADEVSIEALAELNKLRKLVERQQELLDSAGSRPPDGVGGLAQGADRVGIQALADATVQSSPSSLGAEQKVITGSVGIDATWDEVFAVLGTDLLHDAEQQTLQQTMSRWLTDRFGAGFRAGVHQQMIEQGATKARVLRMHVNLRSEDFGTILIQFKALGLITRSTRRRSVNDSGTYWGLTPYGDTHLTTLRAISRPKE